MLTPAQRTAILALHAQKVPKREIARLLEISRQSVRQVLKANSAALPKIERAEKASPFRSQILELLPACKGNLVRVHEELTAAGATFSYQTLTAFCRREGIGHTPPVPVGRHEFAPGQEMQHDTSPHTVTVGGRVCKAQTASAVLCYSRLLFFQILPTFQRFDCKVFLTEALRYFQGATERVMIDNTHVVVLRGTGRQMEPVPEMAAFAERLGFTFVAHAVGDANRSGRVERPFHFIENNFLAGRTFTGWEDLNRQARAWCDRVNATYKKHLRAMPTELYAVERPRLKPLPAWLPEVYRLHHRLVDVEGYVSLHSNRYSVPASFIGRGVEVREMFDRIEIELDARHVVTHRRILMPDHERVTLPEHRPARGAGLRKRSIHPERAQILGVVPQLEPYVDNLERRGRKVVALLLRHLLRLLRDYPREAFLGAVAEAERYGLYDLDRVERMILRRIRSEYFRLEEHQDD